MNIPEDLLYTSEHEWIKVEGDIAWVGITDYAQHELGDIVHWAPVNTEGVIAKGAVLGTIDAVKTVADMFTPITGEILEVNIMLDDSPELMNTEPYGKGWIAKYRITKPEELKTLMNHKAYRALIGE